ncbi:MAG: hypothetical protein ACJ77K_14910 [Bacteroidia bacterium]
MRTTLPLLIFVLLSAASCGGDKKETTSALTSKTDTIGIEDSYRNAADTLHISEPLLAITWPDSLMMEQLKSKDSDAFYTGADDYSFYTSGLMQQADSLGIKNISTSLRYLDFSLPGGKHYFLNRSTEDLAWGVYAYNGSDTPAVFTAFDEGTSYLKKYFNK